MNYSTKKDFITSREREKLMSGHLRDFKLDWDNGIEVRGKRQKSLREISVKIKKLKIFRHLNMLMDVAWSLSHLLETFLYFFMNHFFLVSN